ncbi:RICIN domain-containing protein [Kitasatospora paracochleata]|uniref:Fibronectin type-III domain-containing protein n=1 Tax=Kitasatospora paracochleata TaxID=58354 RepID=A0ABT1J9I8_9ACTN|nr:RICIN domain-containing protein [Kitasatospora paracochleata]MCP2313864.1 hypothetical protein [Kitasatospora paracochleata]
MAKRRRSTRVVLVAAVLAATGVFAGTAYLGGALEDGRPVAAEVAAPTAPASGPAHDAAPQPVAAIPADDSKRGLVYTGLQAAPKGDRCAGVLRTGAGACTHGPDAPPKGVDIAKDTAPVAKPETDAPDGATPAAVTAPVSGTAAAPAAGQAATGPSGSGPAAVDAQAAPTGSAAAAPPSAAASTAPTQRAAAGPADQTVPCDGDGSTGNRVQVVYVHGPGKDRYAQYASSFRTWAAAADAIYFASAQETGGVRHIRFVTGADCTPVVLNLEVPDSALAEFGAMNSALAAKGLDRRDRKYMMFADANVYCGIGTFAGDERPGQDNLSNFGPSYGRTDSGCWSGATAAHELGHNLGAVNNSAPNSSKAAHCTDEWDIMCYSDAPYYPAMRTICPDRGHDERLDCNHDDYYNTSPKAGSYLATHWNVANNRFLMTGNGTGPDPQPTPTPTPTPSPTRPTTPTPTPTGGPSTGPDVTVGQLAADSVVVSWPSVASAQWYQVQLNGTFLTWVGQTSVRIYNLRPDTDYTVAVAVRDRSGRDSAPGRTARFHTPGSGSTTPTPQTAYTLANGAAGVAAEIWGGKSADNTVLVGSPPTGYLSQRWYFDDAGGGYSRIRSAVSGKCLQLGGAPVAGQWVAQQACDTSNAAQQWRLASAGGGLSVTARGSSLVLGVSNRPYYGAWLLDLEDPAAAGYHTWSVQKAS